MLLGREPTITTLIPKLGERLVGCPIWKLFSYRLIIRLQAACVIAAQPGGETFRFAPENIGQAIRRGQKGVIQTIG